MTNKDLETRILNEEEFNNSLMKTMKYYAEKIKQYQEKYEDCLELYGEVEWYKANGYRIVYKLDINGLSFEPEKRQIGFQDETKR